MSAQPKVLIVMDSLTCGGAEKSLVSLLPFLVDRGYDITLMIRAEGGLFSTFVPRGVKTEIYRPPVGGFMSRLHSWMFSLGLRIFPRRHGAEVYWQNIGRHLPRLEGEWDVAIAYHQGFPTFFVADKVTAKRKYCWVNVDLKEAGYRPSFCKRYYSVYDRIIPVADILATRFAQQGFITADSNLTTVYDILNPTLIKNMAQSDPPFEQGEMLKIVTVGRMTRQKGYDLAILAARKLKERGLRFVWHFVGGGVLESELSEMIFREGLQDYIVMEGVQSNPYRFMAAADIYVQTSRFEGYGLTVAEARILGKPIVSTDFPVIHHQITDGVDGLIVGMNPGEIADGIMRLAADPAFAAALGKAAGEKPNTTAMTESLKVINLIENGSHD